MRHKHSDYMHWAKTQSRARYQPGHQRRGRVPAARTGRTAALEINGDNSYGYAPLQAGDRASISAWIPIAW